MVRLYNNRAIVYSYKGETDKLEDLHKAQSMGIAVNPDFLKKIEEHPSTLNQYFISRPPSSKAPKRRR